MDSSTYSFTTHPYKDCLGLHLEGQLRTFHYSFLQILFIYTIPLFHWSHYYSHQMNIFLIILLCLELICTNHIPIIIVLISYNILSFHQNYMLHTQQIIRIFLSRIRLHLSRSITNIIIFIIPSKIGYR